MVEKNDTKEWLETSPSNDPLYIMVNFSWNRWLKMSTRADEETTPKEREKKKKKKKKKKTWGISIILYVRVNPLHVRLEIPLSIAPVTTIWAALGLLLAARCLYVLHQMVLPTIRFRAFRALVSVP